MTTKERIIYLIDQCPDITAPELVKLTKVSRQRVHQLLKKHDLTVAPVGLFCENCSKRIHKGKWRRNNTCVVCYKKRNSIMKTCQGEGCSKEIRLTIGIINKGKRNGFTAGKFCSNQCQGRALGLRNKR